MSVLGLYVPGGSVVHRAPPWLKLALLVVLAAASTQVNAVWQILAGLAGVAAGYLLAGLPVRLVGAQLRPLAPLLIGLGALQAIVAGWETAALVVGVVTGLVLLAGLVTLTTRTSDLIDVLVAGLRPLRRLGVDPERIGLLFALSIRSVPVVLAMAEQVRDAQRARGLTASPSAYAVPLLIRTLRHADRLGEALVARGADD